MIQKELLSLFLLILCGFSLSSYAVENKSGAPNDSFLKSCDAQWSADRQGKNKHIGKMVCNCVNQLLKQAQPEIAKEQLTSFITKSIPNCVTSGVLENTVSRAVYERETDAKIIGGICDASWISLMRTYNPGDPQFNSKKVCQCAVPGLTELITGYDALAPQELHSKIIGLVNQCDTHKLPASLATVKPLPVVKSQGVFSLEIRPSEKPEYNKIAEYLKEHGMLRKIVAAMNENIKLPNNVKIITTTTNRGPYYDRDEDNIYLDYMLMSVTLNLYDRYYPDALPANRWHYFNNVIRFLLYHELGHALIDLYRLPVLGQEEDAADALGSIIALNYIKSGYHVLLDSADFFNLMTKTLGTEKSDYWDEHSLNEQRYYRLLCYAYGKYPKKVKEKIQEYYEHDLSDFVQERSEFCADQYDTTYNDWMSFLTPYFNAPPPFKDNK